MAPLNDNIAAAQVITGTSGFVTGNNTDATLEQGEVFLGRGGFNSVWFSWTPSESFTYIFDTQGTSFGAILSVWTYPTGTAGGVDPGDQRLLVWTQASWQVASFVATAGTTYYIVLSSINAGDVGPYTLNWAPVPLPPPPPPPPTPYCFLDEVRITRGVLYHGDYALSTAAFPDEATVTVSAAPQTADWVYTPSTLEIPVSILTLEQYASIPAKCTSSSFPIALYDDGQYPVRTISVYPVPSMEYYMVLWLWQPLLTITDLDAELHFPPGYERALKFNLAVELAAEFGSALPNQVRLIASESLAKLKRQNSTPAIAELGSFRTNYPWDWILGGFLPWRKK